MHRQLISVSLVMPTTTRGMKRKRRGTPDEQTDHTAKKEEQLNEAETLSSKGAVCDSQGRYEEALEHYGRSLAIRRQTTGEDHPIVAETLSSMGSVYDSQGRYEEALEHYGRSLEIYRKANGE